MSETRIRLQPEETAKYIHVSYGKLMRMVREKEIPHFKIGNRTFFFQDSIDLWMANLERQSMQPENGLRIAR